MSSFPEIIYRTDAPSALDLAPQGTICKDSRGSYYVQLSSHESMVWYECSTLEDAQRMKQNITLD